MTRTASSSPARCTASCSSSGIGGTIVLRLSGRFRVMVAIGPSTA
jgi:hypothetical protein